MAKRRRSRRRAPRRVVRRASTRRSAPFRRRRKSGGSSTSRQAVMAASVGGFLYGAVREPLSNLVSPVTSRIPLAGNMADELFLGLGAAWLAKRAKGKMAKRFLMGAVTLESARLGEQLAGPLVARLVPGGSTSPTAAPVLGATFR